MKFQSYDSAEVKRRWKIVRMDDCSDVAGEIITADETSGECCLLRSDGAGGTKAETLSFGPLGFRIVSRRR